MDGAKSFSSGADRAADCQEPSAEHGQHAAPDKRATNQ
jgi:hypothetical protein